MSLGFNVIVTMSVISKIEKGFQENIHVNGTKKLNKAKQNKTSTKKTQSAEARPNMNNRNEETR